MIRINLLRCIILFSRGSQIVATTYNRCKSHISPLIQTLWTYPIASSYWTSFFKTFSEIFGIPFKPSPLTAIFDVAKGDLNLSKRQANVEAFTLLVARHLILLNCKQASPPSHIHWIRALFFFFLFLHLEKMNHQSVD